jgi:disulfide bond formation protein DsbB
MARLVKTLGLGLILVSIAILLAGCDGDRGVVETEVAVENPVGDPVVGETLFQTTCFACHGMDVTGLPGQGKDLTTSEFTRELSDEDYVEFVKNGRDISDPMNTTGVDMPPYGGKPALSEMDLFHIVAYIRTLEK